MADPDSPSVHDVQQTSPIQQEEQQQESTTNDWPW
jgi:hypothetical protein